MNIGVIGFAGSGKDFIAEYMIKRYGFTRYAFADNVKLVAETWFPDLYGKDGEKPRALLQAIGMLFREIDEDVWIKSMFTDVDSKRERDIKSGYRVENVIVTDCRLPNEYEALKERGFIFIQIDVDEKTRLQRMRERGDIFSEKDMKHHTEQHYSEFKCDYYIFNQGSKELAYAQVDGIVERLIELRDKEV